MTISNSVTSAVARIGRAAKKMTKSRDMPFSLLLMALDPCLVPFPPLNYFTSRDPRTLPCPDWPSELLSVMPLLRMSEFEKSALFREKSREIASFPQKQRKFYKKFRNLCQIVRNSPHSFQIRGIDRSYTKICKNTQIWRFLALVHFHIAPEVCRAHW